MEMRDFLFKMQEKSDQKNDIKGFFVFCFFFILCSLSQPVTVSCCFLNVFFNVILRKTRNFRYLCEFYPSSLIV